jgi:hypothetical protein
MLIRISGRMKPMSYLSCILLRVHSFFLCTQDITTQSTMFVRLASLQQENKTE